jgi:hypothetical protein
MSTPSIYLPNSEELKHQCPWCECKLFLEPVWTVGDIVGWVVYCRECDISTPCTQSKVTALLMWEARIDKASGFSVKLQMLQEMSDQISYKLESAEKRLSETQEMLSKTNDV